MAKKPLPTVEQLRQLLRYEPETGHLFWKERGPEWFRDGFRTAQGEANNWNVRYAGKRAGGLAQIGYRYVALPDRARVPEHRIIWAMQNGEWPDVVDHIDGDKLNNRLSNLRNVTQAENMKNARRWSHNSSGVTGVCRESRTGNWLAYIKVGQKDIRLLSTKRFAEAVASRRAAEIKYGFTARHGR